MVKGVRSRGREGGRCCVPSVWWPSQGPLAKGWLVCSPAYMLRLGDHRVTGLLRAAAAQATVGPDWIVNKADVRILISSPRRPTYLHHTCSCALFLCRFVCVGRVLQQVVFDSSKPVGVGGFAQVFKGRCDVHLVCTRCVLLSSFIPTPTPIHALTDTLTHSPSRRHAPLMRVRLCPSPSLARGPWLVHACSIAFTVVRMWVGTWATLWP